MTEPVRVLVCDDSAVARQLLRAIIGRDERLTVVAEASDGSEAVRKVAEIEPDVITMDIQMPGMDGLEATGLIMQQTPTPIVVVSALHPTDVDLSINALAAGALAILEKPSGPSQDGFARRAKELTTTVRLMSEIAVVTRRAKDSRRTPAAVVAADAAQRGRAEIVAIGASTGGPNALAEVVSTLPANLAVPVLIVQHITAGYHEGLAKWLGTRTTLDVQLATDGAMLQPGAVFVAPGDRHLGVSRGRRIELSDAPPIGMHRPAATHLFRSVTQAYGSRALGVILTGMGEDGADGLAALKQGGGQVIAQDEATSVVWGMPAAAVARGLPDVELPLDLIAEAIVSAAVSSG